MKQIGIVAAVLLCACATTSPSVQSGDQREVTEKGSPNYIAKFASRAAIESSAIYEAPGALVGVGTTFPDARLHVRSNFSGGGATEVVENLDPAGDVAVDFHSAGGLVGNVGLVQSHGSPRFFVLENNPQGLPLTLAENGGNVGIGTNTSTNILTVKQGAGHAVADGWDTYSSRRLKDNIRSLAGALDKVEQLRGVSFDWKTTGKHDVGLIAEEVAQVLPEAVSFEANGQDASSVDYSRLTAVLLQAIKEQQSEIRDLELQLGKLRNESVTRSGEYRLHVDSNSAGFHPDFTPAPVVMAGFGETGEVHR